MYNFIDHVLNDYKVKNGVSCKLISFFNYINSLLKSKLPKKRKTRNEKCNK